MTPAQARKALEAAEARYWAEVDRVAAEVRKSHVIPFCELHGVRYSAGMGSWSFHGKAQESTGRRPERAWGMYDTSELPKRLQACLRLYLINRANDLGSMTPDYTPANYKG